MTRYRSVQMNSTTLAYGVNPNTAATNESLRRGSLA